ncbi:MAG: hypothetical protein EB168_07845 [Euryarchaeota archaeon]|nr:hypothetical protein [Euryarchaeota archaeon]
MNDEPQDPTPGPSTASPSVEINMSRVATTIILAIIAWVGYSIHDLTQSVGALTLQMTKMGSSMEHHSKTLEKWESALQATQTTVADLKEEYRDNKHQRSERITKLEHIVSGIQREQTNRTTDVSAVHDLQKRVSRIEERVPMD